MNRYTVCCGYASHYHNTVTVEADTLGEALEKAIEQAGDDPHWKSVDQASQTFVDAVAEGMDADPWGDTAIPVPDLFSEKGEPPVVTLTALRPPRRHRGLGRHRPYSFRRRCRHGHDGDHRSIGPAGQQTSGHDRTQSRWRSGCDRERRPCTRGSLSIIPPSRSMASMLPVDPIVNGIQHETPCPRTPRLRTRASASLFRFPACHESAARDLSTPLPSSPTHASTPGRARARRRRSISGAPEGAVRAATHPFHVPAWSMP